ncbi:DUF6221 family protein [Nocardia otitidiscaviarum]|uniref:DUF6221 family protein n=1 Tax=Nocardia otitidiscaviarum TaxID=1823 RepID=UPI0004A71C9B|nr:DUF6221 family protein [Nocardia otitidiscaviarum]
MTDDIVRFIRDRVAEDEQLAGDTTPGPWDVYDRGHLVRIVGGELGAHVAEWDQSQLPDSLRFLSDAPDVQHILANDPDAVMRRCAMIRAMMRHAEAARVVDDLADYDRGTTAYDGQKIDDVMYRDIAAYWSTHPDYREEWKP